MQLICVDFCVYLQCYQNFIYMAKYSRELDETLERKVKELAIAVGFREMGITVEPIRLNSKKSYGEVIKANELVTLFTGDVDMICIAINEELFENLDEQSQDVLIESLLSQVFYDSEKEKISISKEDNKHDNSNHSNGRDKDKNRDHYLHKKRSADRNNTQSSNKKHKF